jgi:hypothetical protein
MSGASFPQTTMVLRNVNPLTSSTNEVDSERDSILSSQPPTYNSIVTPTPTNIHNDPATTIAHARYERVSSWTTSLPSTLSVASPVYDGLFEPPPVDAFSGRGTSVEFTMPGETSTRHSEFL